jgi:hypothetical protein
MVRLFLCVLPIMAASLSMLLATAWHPTVGAVVVASLACIMSFGLIAISSITVLNPDHPTHRWLPLVFLVGSRVGFAPAATRALLPWEEPGNGDGSPMAVLMSIVIVGVLGLVFVTIPIFTVGFLARRAAKQASALP